MKYIPGILISLVAVFLLSCEHRLNFDKAIIPVSPVNFSEVNSVFDDYNSDVPKSEVSDMFDLIFSSNRASQGNDFDFIGFRCWASANLITGDFSVFTGHEQNDLLDTVNSQANELGPYLSFDLYSDYYFGNYPEGTVFRFFYSSDVNGSDDIFYIYYSLGTSGYIPAGEPVALTAINTVLNDSYLAEHPGEQSGRETVYFTSNRDGGYDIYRAISEAGKTIEQSVLLEIDKVETLNSEADDKCPYIRNDLMVFTSDRPGGYGEFDLWFSVYNGNSWGVPENFGDRINTGYNEYRPVIIETDKDRFLNDLMIFSSDRPGGKGMYDLYYAGLIKLID